ncbi:MAG TPA: DUF2804 domain-containing protein [Myxococcota bacterium]|nr:DUF2804 domain-containing protein [Myxococcota bacterium]HRY94770.1 DUF2804 domain-containing protein [Myxococcota bacterium]HSA21707.1 DUF2804 domain-containing protein [Myxococcota bacterium]
MKTTKRILEAVPARAVDEEGRPRFGAYLGLLEDSSLTGLVPELDRTGLDRVLQEKAWHFAAFTSARWVSGLAIVRLGYAATGFFYLFDRQARKFLADVSMLGPPLLSARVADRPGDGAESVFRMPGMHLSIVAPPGTGQYHVRARLSGERRPPIDLALELERGAAPEAVSAICPVRGRGSVHLTVKQVALPVTGRLLVDGQPAELGPGPMGMLDYSHGYLDRQTRWMWACGGMRDGRGQPLGLNLVAGFNQGLENAIWLGERPLPVGEVHFRRGTDGPLAPWEIESDDGRVQLTFQPEGVRQDDRDVGPVASHYVQPVGVFSGTLRGERGRKIQVRDLPGVTEEHDSRW